MFFAGAALSSRFMMWTRNTASSTSLRALAIARRSFGSTGKKKSGSILIPLKKQYIPSRHSRKECNVISISFLIWFFKYKWIFRSVVSSHSPCSNKNISHLINCNSLLSFSLICNILFPFLPAHYAGRASFSSFSPFSNAVVWYIFLISSKVKFFLLFLW